MSKYAILHIPTGKYITRTYDMEENSWDLIPMECFTDNPEHCSLFTIWLYYFTLNLKIYDNFYSNIEDADYITINRNELTIIRISK